MLSSVGIQFRHIMCEYVFNVGITIDTYYMSELCSSYSRLYDEFDQNNVVNNQTFMDTVGTAVTQWLRCYAKNRKVTGSIPTGVIGIFR